MKEKRRAPSPAFSHGARYSYFFVALSWALRRAAHLRFKASEMRFLPSGVSRRWRVLLAVPLAALFFAGLPLLAAPDTPPDSKARASFSWAISRFSSAMIC
jgi:hypothetical protein